MDYERVKLLKQAIIDGYPPPPAPLDSGLAQRLSMPSVQDYAKDRKRIQNESWPYGSTNETNLGGVQGDPNPATALFPNVDIGLDDVGMLAASVAPGSGDVIAAQDSMKYARQAENARKEGRYLDMPGLYAESIASGLGALPLFGGMVRGVTKGARSLARQLEDAGDIASSIERAQARTYNYKTKEQYFDEAEKTGKKIDVPWRSKGPRKTPEEIVKMEAALKFGDPDPSLYQTRNLITPEDIPTGSILTPAGGDGSGVGKILNTLAGKTSTIRDGGAEFMQRWDNPVWASLNRNLANLENVGLSNIGRGKYAITTPMGPASMNFNNMMNSLMSEQMRVANITKKNIKEFNEAARGVIPKEYAKTFPGIDAPNVEEWMKSIPGKWRGAILQKMDQGKWLERGFPDIGANRAAVSRDGSRWLPQLDDPMAGYNVTKMQEGALRTKDWGRSPAHGTYDAVLPGEQYQGGMDVLLPRSEWFPTHQQKIIDAGITGAPKQGSWRGSRIEEEMTPQLQDKLMKLREKILKNR